MFPGSSNVYYRSSILLATAKCKPFNQIVIDAINHKPTIKIFFLIVRNWCNLLFIGLMVYNIIIMNLRGAYVLNLIFYILLPKDNFWRVAGEYKKQKKKTIWSSLSIWGDLLWTHRLPTARCIILKEHYFQSHILINTSKAYIYTYIHTHFMRYIMHHWSARKELLPGG